VDNETTTYTYLSDHSVQDSFSFSPQTAYIKWSIKINSAFSQGLNLSYVLSVPNGGFLPPGSFFPNRTSNNITTYYIPLEEDLYAVLKIRQLAVVDNVSLPIDHLLQASRLVLQFPPFNSSLFYDPSIGLAQLLRGGESSSNIELSIIGIVVAGVVFTLVVCGVLLLGAVIAKRKANRKSHVNFDSLEK